MRDLFQTPELIPSEVKAVLDTWDCNAGEYEECSRIEQELKPLGYTFDWYLDGEPYNLRKVNKYNQ